MAMVMIADREMDNITSMRGRCASSLSSQSNLVFGPCGKVPCHFIIPATLVRVLTPSVSPNEKTFKVVLVCCSRDPSPHPTSIFGSFSGSFAYVCSRPSGVPVTSPLFLAAFEHVLHLFVFVTRSALPITHHLYTYS